MPMNAQCNPMIYLMLACRKVGQIEFEKVYIACVSWKLCRVYGWSLSHLETPCIFNYPGITLWMRPANERRRYIVTSSLIGWAHIQNYVRLPIWPYIWLCKTSCHSQVKVDCLQCTGPVKNCCHDIKTHESLTAFQYRCQPQQWYWYIARLILVLRPANERRRYFVTTYRIGCTEA